MSNSNSTSTSASPPVGGSRRRTSWIVWLWFWVTIGLVAIIQIPKEITAWKFAAALEAREAGNKELAQLLLQHLMHQDADDPAFLGTKYRWASEDGRHKEALSALQELIKQSPKNVRWNYLRSQELLHLRRYAEAIADAKQVKDIAKATGWPVSNDHAANGLAYARAVGKYELDQATEELDSVVNNARAELDESTKRLQSARAQHELSFFDLEQAARAQLELLMVLDTRGFARLQRSEPESAEPDLDEAVRLADEYQKFMGRYGREFSSRHRKVNQWEDELKARRQTLAVIVYHRGLAREQLNRDEEAKQDFDRVRELIGKEPDESLF